MASESTTETSRDWKKGWKLFYHPGLGGRGMYVRCLFEMAGVPYEDVWQKVSGATAYESYPVARKSKEDGSDPQALFYPIVHHGDDFVLSQAAAICFFLARLFGFEPKSIADAARAQQIVLTIGDCIVETQQASHPIDMQKDYFEQKEEADKETTILCRYDSSVSGSDAKQGRLFRLLYVCECELARNSGGKSWFYGSQPSVADVYCACFMRAFQVSRPVEYAQFPLPLLKAHRSRFEAQEWYQQFKKSDRFPPVQENEHSDEVERVALSLELFGLPPSIPHTAVVHRQVIDVAYPEIALIALFPARLAISSQFHCTEHKSEQHEHHDPSAHPECAVVIIHHAVHVFEEP